MKEGADKYKQQGWPLHVLVNNASVAAPEGQIGQHTEEGLEITMATNHFGGGPALNSGSCMSEHSGPA